MTVNSTKERAAEMNHAQRISSLEKLGFEGVTIETWEGNVVELIADDERYLIEETELDKVIAAGGDWSTTESQIVDQSMTDVHAKSVASNWEGEVDPIVESNRQYKQWGM